MEDEHGKMAEQNVSIHDFLFSLEGKIFRANNSNSNTLVEPSIYSEANVMRSEITPPRRATLAL